MIETSFSIGPIGDSLKEQIRVPFSAIISPCSYSGAEIRDFDPNIPRCRTCEAYFNNYCETSKGKWICSICGAHNKTDKELNLNLKDVNHFRLIPDDKDELFIFVFSLKLHPNDFNIIKTLFTDFISKLKKGKFMFIFHNKDGFYFLTPSKSHFKIVENKLIHTDNQKHNLLPACLAQYVKAEYIDLSSHIFDASQLPPAIIAIMHMQPSIIEQDFSQVLSVIKYISTKLPDEMIRVVNIIPQCSPDILNYDEIRAKDIRIDVLTAIYDKAAFVMGTQIPGFVVPFTKNNFVGKLNWVYNKRVNYRCYMNVRSAGCACSWNRLRWHYSLVDNSLMFIPDVIEDQPFVIDIKPTYEDPIIQITVKTTKMFSIFNIKLKASTDKSVVLSTLNVPVAEWIWVSRSIGIEGASDAITMAAMPIIESLDEKDPKRVELERFVRAIPFVNAMNGTSLTAAPLIVANPPRKLSMSPKVEGDHDTMTITLLDQIFAAGLENCGEDKANELGICPPPRMGIPGWLLDFKQ